MKSCELCKGIARMYCESDQANLCWSCDAKVHSANFLVARHSRRLLCHVCQLPTPWSASGSNLGSTVSACERCFLDGAKSGPEAELSRGDNLAEDDDEEDDDDEVDVDEEDDDDEVDVDEEDEDEISTEDVQVVPWSSTPPPAASSSSDDSFLMEEGEVSVNKRLREFDTDLQYQDNRRRLLTVRTPPESPSACGDVNESSIINTARPAKLRRTERIRMDRAGRSKSRSSSVVDALGRFQRKEVRSSRDLAEFCRLGADSTTVDFECSETPLPLD